MPSHALWRATWFQAAFEAQNACVPLKGERSFQKLSFQRTYLSFPLHVIMKLKLKSKVSFMSRELLSRTRLKDSQSSSQYAARTTEESTRNSVADNHRVTSLYMILLNFCYILASLKAKIMRLLVCQTVCADYIIALNLLRSCPPLLPMGLIAASYRIAALIYSTFIQNCYKFHLMLWDKE